MVVAPRSIGLGLALSKAGNGRRETVPIGGSNANRVTAPISLSLASIRLNIRPATVILSLKVVDTVGLVEYG